MDNTDNIWMYMERIDDYYYWAKFHEGRWIYNVTKDGKPPSKNAGGYPSLAELKKIKHQKLFR